MLTNVISFAAPTKARCQKLITWKHSYNRLYEEHNIVKKKQQALNNLFETGKISESTRDTYNNEILQALNDIEKQQQQLLEKMQIKITELQSQIKTLEVLLTNYEIQHAVEEIDEATYQQEITLLNTALETARNELSNISEAATQLCPIVAPEPTPPTIEETAVAEPETALPPEEPENVQIAPPEPEIVPNICTPESDIVVNPEPIPAMTTEQSAESVSTENPIETPTEEVMDNTAAENITVENIEIIENAPETESPNETLNEEALESPAEAVSVENNETIEELSENEPQIANSNEALSDVTVDTEIPPSGGEQPEEVVEVQNESIAEVIIDNEVPISEQAESPAEEAIEVPDEILADSPAPLEADLESDVEPPEEVLADTEEVPEEPTLDAPLEQVTANIEGQMESTVDVDLLQEDSPIEIVPQETIQQIDETAQEAHPTEAPKEAHPEGIEEDVAEQVQDSEESQGAVEASAEENSEY